MLSAQQVDNAVTGDATPRVEAIEYEMRRNETDIDELENIRVEVYKLREKNYYLRTKLSEGQSNRQMTKHTPREVMEIMPEFNPSTQLSGLSADQFVERVNSFKLMFGWGDDVVLCSGIEIKGCCQTVV